MSPPSESIVAEGQPATGRMEIVLAGDRRVIVDRTVDGAALSRLIAGAGAAMIPVPSGVRVRLATGVTDKRRGMNTLALQVQQDLGRDPHAVDLYAQERRDACRATAWGVRSRPQGSPESQDSIRHEPCAPVA